MIVEPQHFEYLALQRGGISELRHDFDAWKRAYDTTLLADFHSIQPALPSTARWMLDVGGGLSGIGAAVNAHYDGRLGVAVLDGKACAPKVRRHAIPYNNATMTSQFLRLNGVHNQIFFDAAKFDRDAFRSGPRYDIVISTQAWCFHFEPEEYLSAVEDQVAAGTVIILDVRKHHEDWLETLDDVFGEHRILVDREKWRRCAWTVR